MGVPTTGRKDRTAAIDPQRKAPWTPKIRKETIRIPPSITAIAPLAIRVVRTMFLNSLRRITVFFVLKGIARKRFCIKSDSSPVKR